MNKLFTTIKTTFDDPNISVVVPVSIVVSSALLVILLMVFTSSIFNIPPPAVLGIFVGAIAFPIAIYNIKKNWPKDEA